MNYQNIRGCVTAVPTTASAELFAKHASAFARSAAADVHTVPCRMGKRRPR
jgi:hypothetical protein